MGLVVSFSLGPFEENKTESPEVGGPEQPNFETQGGLTEEEIEELEKELEKSFNDFDADMQREKDFAQERANENTSDGSIGGIGDFEEYDEEAESSANETSESASQATNSTNGSANSSGASGASSDSSQAPSGDANTAQQSSGAKPKDLVLEDQDGPIDSRDNDDVVAKQLRELAENETDPALKKLYWQDYRNYKSGN